jgi:hypothetical protein
LMYDVRCTLYDTPIIEVIANIRLAYISFNE